MRGVFDIETWKDVVGFEDRYEVSSLGRVRSKSYLKSGRNMHGPFSFRTKPKILKQFINQDGYAAVDLNTGCVRALGLVHRLVATAFLCNPGNKPQVNHKDSLRSNNSVDNLEWVTAQENVQHSYSEGLNSNAMDKHPRAILTQDNVQLARKYREDGVTVKDIASLLGVKPCTVYAALSGKNWRGA